MSIEIEPVPPTSAELEQKRIDAIIEAQNTINELALTVPAELSVTRDLLTLYAVHADENGQYPVPPTDLDMAHLSAFVALERRIAAIEKRLGI